MTISTSWTVSIGTKGSFTDFSSRTAGLTVTQRLQRGALGYGNAAITLRNNDGELTPNAGGTYDSVDWFSQLVRLTATVTDGTFSETVPVFTGTIEDFDVLDDGVTSNVAISCLDFMAISGRSPAADISAYYGPDTLSASGAFRTMYHGSPGGLVPGVELGLYGGTTARISTPAVNTGTIQQYYIPLGNVTVGEVVNDSILPIEICHAWPTELKFAGETGAIYDPDYVVYFSSADMTRTSTSTADKRAPIQFEFVENPAGNQLIANRIGAGYTFKEMRNYANVEGTFTGATKQIAESSSSISKYGQSAVGFRNAATFTDAQSSEAATRWANRFDDVGYTVDRLTLKASTVTARCANAAYERFADLLDIRSGLWNVATVEYTPTGASTAVTDVSVLYGRTINATPSDTTITCELVPASNYQSFVLDSGTLGVLDTNRLG
jgi:hypothetical protein